MKAVLPDEAPSVETPPSRALPLGHPDALERETAPAAAKPLQAALAALDSLFDRAYGSRWNPLHQSGPLVIALMLVVIATGVYLLLVYRIGAPYESMQRIQAQVWAGRWLRALHRYASDAAVACIALHALRMFAEGRTWGPRVLAWVTGLLLTGATLVVGWTGYVLVWDMHGLILGAAGARLFDSLGLLATPIGRIFGGGAAAPSSFFFLNLFVHMSLPLGMTLLVWIHTLRLARGRWLPETRVWVPVALAFTVLSFAVPVALGPAADGLRLGDRATYDVFYTAWVPIAARLAPPAAWAASFALALLPLSVPLWWRPRRDRRRETALHNPAACTGCGQCAIDCPFEAIAMGPNPTGRGSETIAIVNSARCVACGLCSGSCDQLAIGPPGRDGHAQVRAVKAVNAAADPGGFALVHCSHDGVGEALAGRARAAGHRVACVEVDCAGSLHSLAVSQLSDRHRGVFVLGCPPHRCRSREGTGLALERLLLGRHPELKTPLDPTRVRFTAGASADLDWLAGEFELFARAAGARAVPRRPFAPGIRGAAGAILATLLGLAALAATATLSQWSAGATPPQGAVRLAWRLPGQSWLDCRELSADEIARMPAHMRRTQDCRTVYLRYRLRAWLDGRLVTEREVAPLGARGDRPLFVEQDLPAAPGRHAVRVEFTPVHDPRGVGLVLSFADSLLVEAGRARLVGFDTDTRTLRAD
ncbi:MAG: cytochrome b N-terminal domain-containing protein [Candidatus Eisenbacteria bacterium]|nr:cytochrome b N-terminal domain-containing protein [Candidatus Eisenbacteria bacterium]